MSERDTRIARKLWDLGLDCAEIAGVLECREADVHAAICPQGIAHTMTRRQVDALFGGVHG